jgi:hypothetical protein
MSKATVAMGGFREIQDVLPDSLKKADRAIISLADIGLDGDEDEPKLVFLPLAIPAGWHIPIEHKVNEALSPSEGKEYHPTMIAWLEGISKVPLEPVFFEHVAEVRNSPNSLRIE